MMIMLEALKPSSKLRVLKEGWGLIAADDARVPLWQTELPASPLHRIARDHQSGRPPRYRPHPQRLPHQLNIRGEQEDPLDRRIDVNTIFDDVHRSFQTSEQ